MNWGNKLLLTIVIFVSGICYLVYRSTKTNYDLVEKDYYKQELQYQGLIDGTNSANKLTAPIKISQEGQTISLVLPVEMKNKRVSGDVWFYCAYNSAKDKRFKLKTDSEGIQKFPSESVGPGSYTVRINWNESGNQYYTKTEFSVIE